MTGIQIEYLLGLYFIVVSLTYSKERVENKLLIDYVKLLAGILLLVLAIVGKTFI